MSQVLPESYTFDSEKLIEPIRKASVLRGLGIPITSSAQVFENTTIITTVTDDPKISISPEPTVGVRSTNALKQVRKQIPTISAPVSYKYDELLRVDNGKLPLDRRIDILAGWIADREEAHAFAFSSTGVNDSDARPFIEYGTNVLSYGTGTSADGGVLIGETVTGGTSSATGEVLVIDKVNNLISIRVISGTFTAGGETLTGGTSAKTIAVAAFAGVKFDLANGDDALAALAANIGELIKRYGTLKTRPLILAFNAVAYAKALTLVSSKTDKQFLVGAQEMLNLHGGAGSGFVLINHLGNALGSSDDVVTPVDSTNETMALMLVDGNHFEIIDSALDPRTDGVSTLTGLLLNIVERWFPYVHDAMAIRYEMNVNIA